MSTDSQKRSGLILLGVAGLFVAVLSVLESRIPALAELCGLFGGGCRDTAAFTLVGIPVSILGVVYYAALLASLFFAPSWAFRIVMAGAGVELTFVYAMAVHHIFCPFCLLNLAVITALVLRVFRWARGWEAMALTLLFMVMSLIPFAGENTSISQIAPPSEPDVVARVNGKPITNQELEKAMATKLYDARMELHRAKIKELDQIIQDRLLRLEALRLNIPLEEVRSRALDDADSVGPDDVQAFLAANPGVRSSWEGSEEALQDRVRSFLQRRRNTQAMRTAVTDLQKRYDVEILLQEPPLPWTRVALGNSPVQGPEDAPVTVVEFSDYSCPACRKGHEISMEIREAYRGKIRWVFKDLPLERHKEARIQAEAARCARDQGMFWDYQDMLFMSGQEMGHQRLVDLAVELGMDRDRFESCLRSGRHREDIEADVRAAEEAGVEGTPTFIVNGKLRPGTPSFEELRALIEAELAEAAP